VGSGSYGIIHKAEYWDGQAWIPAVIKYQKCQDRKKIKKVEQEVEILSKFNDERVVKYFGSIINSKNKVYEIGIIMEYCEGGDLHEDISRRIGMKNDKKNQYWH
jgi:serine/threonine protein kinase